MKKIYLSLLLLIAVSMSVMAQQIETVTLSNPKSDKIVVKMMFKNGSMSDPVGKEGITQLTASLMSEGGTDKYTSSDIKSMTYPWASRWGVSVDKEVTVFTFEFHKDHAEAFFPIMTGLVVRPSFSEIPRYSELHFFDIVGYSFSS